MAMSSLPNYLTLEGKKLKPKNLGLEKGRRDPYIKLTWYG
jgi:hypothetical protein